MKLSLVLAITLFGLVVLHWAEAGCLNTGGSRDTFKCDCRKYERQLWGEACKGQGGLGRKNGNSRDPCKICYKRNFHRRNLIFRQSAIFWCANQEYAKCFRIYHGMRMEGRNPSWEGRVSCMKKGAPWTKVGRLNRGQKWPKNNKFLEKIAECPPYAPPKK